MPELIQVSTIVFTKKIIYNVLYLKRTKNFVRNNVPYLYFIILGKEKMKCQMIKTFKDFKENFYAQLTEIEKLFKIENTGNFEKGYLTNEQNNMYKIIQTSIIF